MIDKCKIKCINEKSVNEVKSKMFDDTRFSNISDIFKMLGDQSRLKILYALSKNELCVCDITAILNMEQSAVSHQLRILRNMKLVKYRKEGKIVYYSLYDSHVTKLIKMSVIHSGE